MASNAHTEQRIVMRFLMYEGIKPNEIYSRLFTQYGDETLRRNKTYEWSKHFKEDRTSVSDDAGRGGLGRLVHAYQDSFLLSTSKEDCKSARS